MRIGKASETDSEQVGTMREGILTQKHLLFGIDGSPNNYDLNMGRTGAGGWRTPRHRHNFDQIRYVIKGHLPYGEEEDKVLHEGWVGYFPESIHYGPQERVEGLETMVLQFGGASGFGYLSVAQREAVNAEMNKEGEFKKGMFHYTDDQGNACSRDGSEAIFERATGSQLTFAAPRYEHVVAMNPEAYEWVPIKTEGVAVKWLGTFTERNTRIGFVRLDKGATWGGGAEPSIQILFVTKGRVEVEGKEYGPHTGFEFLANEGPVAIRASEQTEIFCTLLPQF